MVKQQGVSLIELLITIALLGILLTKVVPLGQAWMANTNISNAEKSLVEALGKARNEALQNPEGIIGATTAAATLKINDTSKEITVENAKAAPVVIWKAKIPAPVTISFTGCISTTPIQFNNNGQNISTCTDYTITANGGTNATAKL
ncbi:prepilin-type N-terminal cleavage/methylation domain-containing protein [Acinetobacter sp. ANC 4277]|uniref:prepilin-type N-terminal cleavage/methylation domain-containing protein n=1 Tax=Acinetobacter terrae TaxID=2731247 RepID=UPI001490140B|nr:prepilin-type N-terminal cleavage/methylation domain-containing protein [Acinetobacter terrae]NNG77465.1 prepilin-type N-terminal cleavage/methylation domain-containing protein [Acinetobacter terrae]